MGVVAGCLGRVPVVGSELPRGSNRRGYCRVVRHVGGKVLSVGVGRACR